MALQKFNPNTFLDEWSEEKYSPLYSDKPLAQCIGEAFDIPPTDDYVYRAQAETTLLATQRAIDAKRQHGLHAWYTDDKGKPVCTPTVLPVESPATANVSLPKHFQTHHMHPMSTPNP